MAQRVDRKVEPAEIILGLLIGMAVTIFCAGVILAVFAR